MAKFPEAAKRLFKNKFVCKKCKTVVRTQYSKILQGKVSCPNCQSKSFRQKKRK